MNSKSKESFDQLADRYDSWFDRHAAVFQSELEALKKVIPTHSRGLEIGVGSGRFAQDLGIKTGVESSEKLREMAKVRGINVSEGSAGSIPFANERFDFVLFNTVLCFLDAPVKALSEAKRVLKSNGILIIGMIDRNSPLGQSYVTRKQDNPFYRDAHFYSVDEVMVLINQSGFVQKEIYQTVFSPLEKILTPEPVKPGYG
ncbi:TPA: methyltransferase domain-containing protein [Legionella pneumophila]|nr:class I SAM-dependent methyltransferase [Legionella pneumophila]HAT9646389.1 methyltransferase domain-containing protein [Legionella pneumophila subsp. pneumophila]HCP5222309.1 methyltransferase domain-containing protein [Legionella pneumophila]